MDMGSLVSKRRRLTSMGNDDNIRSLNDFPDAILKHILSFLTTRIAVRTSVLSKRWKYMWTSLPVLDFQEGDDAYDYDDDTGEEYRKRNHFMDFVDRVLRLNDLPWIQKFALSCNVNDEYRIKTWIDTAVRRLNAKEFDFRIRNFNYEDVFPPCLFSSELMQVLKITGCWGDILYKVELPSEIFLPRLKILTLEYATFNDHHPTNLLFASPALEELVLKDCNWEGEAYELIISAPKLRSLSIDERCERLWGNLSSSVKISSSKIEIFEYKGGLIKRYSFPYASSVYKATFDFQNSVSLTEIRPSPVAEILRSVQLVEYLKLSTPSVEVMSRSFVPVFKNLISLEIYGNPVNLSSKGVEMLLHNCARLESIIFRMGISEDCDLDRLLSSKFPFISSTLKNMTIGFRGNFIELYAVRFLLANATCLETIKMFCRIDDESSRRHMENVLSSIPRASKSCKLDLHFNCSMF